MANPNHLGAFTQLLHVGSAEERRSLWRQGMATLARAALEQQPVPLEGIDPRQLLEAVRIAATENLLDDLGWLSPPGAAAAVYELAAAIPVGPERRQLGRQVLLRLYQGDAETFVVLATSLAAESKKALTGTAIKARVALAMALPIGSSVSSDRLALALISRSDLRTEWLSEPASGSLPSRRLAARLLERAARECARRVAQGDSGGLRTFQEPAVLSAFELLLGDREGLVWRHVAVARGILSQADAELRDEIETHLDPRLTPTEWRRAAVSLAASIAHSPVAALERCRELLASENMRGDPGLAGTMILGLARAAEVEPEAAEELLNQIERIGGLEAAEALVELRRERVGEFGARAAHHARERLEHWLASHPEGDDGRISLCEALIDELAPRARREPSLRDQLDSALFAFVDDTPLHALALARAVFEQALARVAELELTQDSDRAGRQLGFRAMRELDVALLESAVLGDLLAIGHGQKEPAAPAPDMAALLSRLGSWLLNAERRPLTSAPIDHLMLRMRRMRTLLHLVDTDAAEGEPGAAHHRERCLQISSLLLARAKHDAHTPLRRIVCAALARALDALVREEICELSDAVISATDHVRSAQDQRVLGEASMLSDFQRTMHAYAALTEATEGSVVSGRRARAALDALDMLAQSLPWSSTLRVTALRRCLLRYQSELEATAAMSSLAEAAELEPSCLSQFEATVAALAQLTLGARRRLLAAEMPAVLASPGSISVLQANIEQRIKGEGADLSEALAEVHDAIAVELPKGIADATDIVLERLRGLPRYRAAGPHDSFTPPAPREPPLPQWLPGRRVLGGFYVVRALGAGGAGSVFVVTRAEERHHPNAMHFALKVPDYNAEAARTLSEQQFLTLFREEARALFSLPRHQNLANFVSLDADAKPKPILVMELCEGPTLGRAIERRELDVGRALELLSGIAEGLMQLHRLGIGHLDIKPSNVILRAPQAGQGAVTPVLVDFGLAGRHIRPGCATGPYGAPEIWGATPEAQQQPPMGADVYAFSCLAYEVLTGSHLFEAASERGLIQAHLGHDGYPARLQALTQHPRCVELCQLLASGLRQHPDERITSQEMRDGLRGIAAGLSQATWPLRAM